MYVRIYVFMYIHVCVRVLHNNNGYVVCTHCDLWSGQREALVVHAHQEHVPVRGNGQRRTGSSGAAIPHEAVVSVLTPEEEADGETAEGEVVFEERHLEFSPVTEVATAFVNTPVLDDSYAVVLHPQASQPLHMVPAVVECDASYQVCRKRN